MKTSEENFDSQIRQLAELTPVDLNSFPAHWKQMQGMLNTPASKWDTVKQYLKRPGFQIGVCSTILLLIVVAMYMPGETTNLQKRKTQEDGEGKRSQMNSHGIPALLPDTGIVKLKLSPRDTVPGNKKPTLKKRRKATKASPTQPAVRTKSKPKGKKLNTTAPKKYRTLKTKKIDRR